MQTEPKNKLIPAQPETPPVPTRGFPVGKPDYIPAIGETGVSQQRFCPLIRQECLKSSCMFWVELFMGPDNKQPFGHCSYYWNTLQFTDIKQQLIMLNQHFDLLLGRGETHAAAK